MVGPVAKREAVAHLRDRFQMSERRACAVIAADRKTTRYRSRRPPETELRARLRDLANERRRFGSRRLFIYCAGRVIRQASIASTGAIGIASAAPGEEPLASALRSSSRQRPMAAASAFSTSSMT